ncbi:hypothetical protein [Streptodolium elevatio]|uniref:Uncharacterized protein n=1 Tax=Streptodolium elevatio TaxID=3157996 RepID=A0ABV3DVG5_9ACTN
MGAEPGRSDGVFSEPRVIPARDAVDWVSYGDHVMVVTVTGERDGPEGPWLRVVDMRVDEAVWSREGAAVPGVFRSYAAGVRARDGRPPYALVGEPRYEVGSTYVVAVFRAERSAAPDGWVVFSGLPCQGGRIGDGEMAGGAANADGVMAAVGGRDAAALRALLAATPPDPVSLKYPHLDGAARFQATAAERSGRSSRAAP